MLTIGFQLILLFIQALDMMMLVTMMTGAGLTLVGAGAGEVGARDGDRTGAEAS